MKDFDVEVGALRSDAKVWDQAAQDLAGPIAAITPLTLEINDLTPLGEFWGLRATYEQARHNMEKLMTQAAKYFDRIGDTLVAVAADYEGTEQTGVRRYERQESQLGGDR
jgi:uncharacterized protein YukE